jgi:hypothetical protein
MRKQMIRISAQFSLLLSATCILSCGVAIKKIASLNPPNGFHQQPADQTKVVATSSKVDGSVGVDELALYSGALLKKGKFEELDNNIAEARTTQDRLHGGYWKLYALYEGISVPNYDKNATPDEWKDHLARLEAWKTAMPNSVTPRISLAGALVNSGWLIRGSDTVDKISDESMRTFQTRAKMAEKELLDAKELKVKCPRWYETMLSVGLALSWKKAKYDQVFEEGFRLAPTYYHLPRQEMTYLLPQWMGEPGDIAKFVNDVSERIGGDEGSIIYYELSATLWPIYSNQIWEKTGLDRQRVKNGYNTLKRVYGIDRYRKNLWMAMLSGLTSGETPDPDQLEEAVNEVGDDWDEKVWFTPERFEDRRKTMRTLIDMMRKSPNYRGKNNQPVHPG